MCPRSLRLIIYLRKYGNIHRQLRALVILDGLIQNAGERFQRGFADEPLLERLRVAATDSLSDDQVKKKCQMLFRSWTTYKSQPGMERVASLYQQLPQRKRPTRKEDSKVVRETEQPAEAAEDPFGHIVSVSGGGGPFQELRSPTSSSASSSSWRPQPLSGTAPLGPPVKAVSKYDSFGRKIKDKRPKEPNSAKKGKVIPFNVEKERPQILQDIAASSLATQNLVNSLRLVDREKQRVSENLEVVKRFESCKALRRQILRYIQNVNSEELLGSLLHVNEELVDALIAYEVLDKSVDDDSDSDDEWESHPKSPNESVRDGMAAMSLQSPAQPPRPTSISMPSSKAPAIEEPEEEDEDEEDDADEDDPFADRNAVSTPKVEQTGMRW